jgi:hypothetical protein
MSESSNEAGGYVLHSCALCIRFLVYIRFLIVAGD